MTAPALVGRLRYWASDTDAATDAARSRLASVIDRLEKHGVQAKGVPGDVDPLQAIEDSLSDFDATAILLVTEERPHENWGEHDLAVRARERFGLPVSHIRVPHDVAL